MEVTRIPPKHIGGEPRSQHSNRKREWDIDSKILKQTPLQIVPNQSRKSLLESTERPSTDTTHATESFEYHDSPIKYRALLNSDGENSNSQAQEEQGTSGVSRELEWYVQRQIHQATSKLQTQLEQIEKSQNLIIAKINQLDEKVQNQDKEINKKTVDKLKIMYDNQQHLELQLSDIKQNLIEPINKEIVAIKLQLNNQ